MDIASWRSWVPAIRIHCVCMLEEHTHIHMMVVRRRRTYNDVSSLTVPSELQQWVVGVSLGEGILLSSRQIEVVHGHGDAADTCSAVERWWEGGKCERQADRRSVDALLVLLFISDLRVGTGHTGWPSGKSSHNPS